MAEKKISSTTDPMGAAAAAQAIMDAGKTQFPKDPPKVEPDEVTLPGGLIHGDEVITTATVRELTGEDEEKLYKSLASNNSFHFINTLLECGTVKIGDEPESETKALLKNLLVGDREQIILGIRRVTYGDQVTVINFKCRECEGTTAQITFEISDDITVKKLTHPRDEIEFDVKLRKGSVARVRLPNGSDQQALVDQVDATLAERNTIMLQRVIINITDPNGTMHALAGEPSLALKMGIADRRTILREIADRAPGPRYNDIKFTHADCGKEVSLAIDLGDLFLG
jgi:hypothetical protein